MLAAEKREAERQLAVAHQTMQHLESQLQEKETALATAITVSCERRGHGSLAACCLSLLCAKYYGCMRLAYWTRFLADLCGRQGLV